jgi:hypothetical protein
MPEQVRQIEKKNSHAPGSDKPSLDALTSETPTFPYTAKQSQEFIELLQCSKGGFYL